MAKASTTDTLTWSQTVCSLAETIVSYTLPVLVRVEGRSYQDSIFFSHGDILKLDSIHWIPSVQACSVTRKSDTSSLEFIHTKDTISIPLEYKGLLKLNNLNAGMTVYSGVEEVHRARPRYVRTIEPVIQNGTVLIDEKCDLEIIIYAQQVVCVSDDNSYVINEDTEIKLLHLPDDSVYTLKQVYDRYPLPQYVSFIQDEHTGLGTKTMTEVGGKHKLFEGTFELSGFVQQDLVVGGCKSVCEASRGVSRDYRGVVIFRPDSSIIKHVDVVICQTENCGAYQTFIDRNFPREPEWDQSTLDETIIMDFLILKYSEPTIGNERHPMEQSDLGPTTHFTERHIPISDNTHQDSSYMDICLYENDDHFYTAPDTPEVTGELELPNVTSSQRGLPKATALFSKLKLKDKIQKLKSKIVTAVQPVTSQKTEDDVTEDGYEDYIVPERELPRPALEHPLNQRAKEGPKYFWSKPSNNREEPYTVQKPKPSTVVETRTQNNGSDVGDDDDEDYIYPESVLQKNTTKQKLKQGPSDSNTIKSSIMQENTPAVLSVNDANQPDKAFASLSVTGLVNLLVTCGLTYVAEMCRQEKVDGSLFLTFTDDDLRAAFSVTQLQLKKIRMAHHHGWTPKR